MRELRCQCGGELRFDGLPGEYYLECRACGGTRSPIPNDILGDLSALMAKEQEIWQAASKEAYALLPVMPGDLFWTVAVPIDRRMRAQAGLPHSGG